MTAFNTNAVIETGRTNTMMTGVVLPNGTTWRFDYDSWGELQEVHTPTGGTISYTWQTSTDWCDYLYALTRTVTSRTVYDGSSYQTWHYANTYQGSGAGVTVTDPLNNATVYSGYRVQGGCTGSVSEAQYYSNGTLIKTV